MMTKIDVVLYSYKSKTLPHAVQSILKNTTNDVFVYVYDQNTISRAEQMLDDRVSYEFIYWDMTQSPCEYRGKILETSTADYILQISDDVILSPGWDQQALSFISGREIVISGNTKIDCFATSTFSIMPIKSIAKEYSITNYIDRNFIFASKGVWNSFKYPYYLKYNGEEEMLSLQFFNAGKTIYCAPEQIYTDMKNRRIEKIYVPFSKDHNYNLVIDALMKDGRTFLNFHSLEGITIHKLPYQTNDVEYNPYSLNFQNIDARKFISTTKAIY